MQFFSVSDLAYSQRQPIHSLKNVNSFVGDPVGGLVVHIVSD